MAVLRLRNVQSQPDLAGEIVKILDGNAGSGLWKVELEKGGSSLQVGASSLELSYCQDVEQIRTREVVLEGLKSQPELNGLTARCGVFVANRQRWKVTVAEGEPPILLRSQSLTSKETGKCILDPVAVGDAPGLEQQKGLFAADSLKRGQIIFEEDPLISAPSGSSCEAQVKNNVEAFLAASEATQKAAVEMYAIPYLRTTQSVGQSGKTIFVRCDNRQEIWRKHGFDVSVEPGKNADVWKFLRVMQANAFGSNNQTEGLFSTLCRANHSCNPNAVRYDNGSGKTLIALQDISVGEEISINYMSDTQLLEPREFRRDAVDVWGFVCCCPRCSQQADDMRTFICPKRCGGHCAVEGQILSACSLCQATHGKKQLKKMFLDEAALVEKVVLLDRKPFMLSANPGLLDELFVAGGVMLSSNHWALARLHDIASGFYKQTKSSKQALQHMTSELLFWEFHLKRSSQQAAWKRKLRADVLVSLGNFPMAFAEYSAALEELKMCVPTHCHHCETIRENLEQALAFESAEAIHAPGAPGPAMPGGCPQQ